MSKYAFYPFDTNFTTTGDIVWDVYCHYLEEELNWVDQNKCLLGVYGKAITLKKGDILVVDIEKKKFFMDLKYLLT